MKPNKDEFKGITNMANAIDKIPNSISGDGSSFVAQLKNALADLRADVETLDEGNTAQNCQSVSMVTLTQRKQGNDNYIDVTWEKSGVYGYKEAFVFYRPINSTKWQLSFVTEGVSGVISNVSVGVKYAVKVVPHNIDGGYDKTPQTYTIEIVSSMVAPEQVSQFVVTFDGGIGHWEWRYEGNDYDFFELRTDDRAGVMNENLIARTSDKEVFAEPNKLFGTAYLYVRNNFGMYSSPVTHTYNISQEGLPPKPTVAKEVNGVGIYMTENIDYESYVVQVEENEYATSDNPFFYQRTSGIIKARYRWVDEDGNMSEWSNWSTINISGLIMGDDISANAIKASHLFAGNIDLSGKLAIVGGAVTLNENGLTCTDNNGDSVVFDDTGMHNVDANGNEFSAVKRLVIGEAFNGRRVTFAKPFRQSPLVICNAKELDVPTNLEQSGNIKLIANAIDISPEGFTMQCLTCLDNGATGAGIGDINLYKGKYKGWYEVVSSYFHNPAGNFNIEITLCISQIVWGSVHKSRGGGKVEFTVEYLDGTVLYRSPMLAFTTKSPYETPNEDGPSYHTEKSTEYITITLGPRWDCVIKMRYYGNDYSSNARVKLESYTYKVLDRIILSEGIASFIATDANEYYNTSSAAATMLLMSNPAERGNE